MSAMKNEEYIDINKIAELKGLKSNRSLRLAIQKGKYIAREVKVFGGKSYEILYSSLEPEIQEKLQDELIKEATQSNCTALVPLNSTTKYPTFISESAKLTALARVDIVKALQNIRTKYKTKKEADSVFLDLYNSGMLLPKVYKFLGSISIGTLHRWIWAYEDNEDYRVLLPNYKYTKQGEYNTILTQEMKDIFIKFLLHPNKFSVTKAIKLTQHILEKKGIESIPHVITFRRYAEHYKKNNYSRWILFREGEKAYHDKVEAYIETLVGEIDDIRVERITQNKERDLTFLKTLAEQYGYIFKITDNQLVFYKTQKLIDAKSAKIINRTECSRINLREKTSQNYKAVTVSYHNPKTGKTITATAKNENCVKGDTLKLSQRVENKQQALIKAKAALSKGNHTIEGSIDMMGNPYLIAGLNVEMKDVGHFSGKYHITQATHSIDRNSGYSLSLEVKNA